MMAAEFLVAESLELKILTWLESRELLINNQRRENSKSFLIYYSDLQVNMEEFSVCREDTVGFNYNRGCTNGIRQETTAVKKQLKMGAHRP